MQYTIFTIDREFDPLTRAQFVGSFHGQEPKGDMRPILGCYNGTRERSWIVRRDDFDRIVRATHWILRQESVLHVAGGNKMECVLEYLADNRLEPLGCMHEVSEAEAMASPAWSYRPDLGIYWIARRGNPDILPAALLPCPRRLVA